MGMPTPQTELTVPQVDEVNVGSCPQDQIGHPPMTPATPVTAEALTSLHSLIEHDANSLDETSKKR